MSYYNQMYPIKCYMLISWDLLLLVVEDLRLCLLDIIVDLINLFEIFHQSY